jgi:hypothetical protein
MSELYFSQKIIPKAVATFLVLVVINQIINEECNQLTVECPFSLSI